MRHIHTSIVSMHIATRGNNKILRAPPPHIISSEEILTCLTRRTLARLRTNKFPFLKSYVHKVDAKSYHSPLCPICKTPTHETQPLRCTTHGNAPKDSGSYRIPKTHIQHTHPQHLSTRIQTSTNHKSTHCNRMG